MPAPQGLSPKPLQIKKVEILLEDDPFEGYWVEMRANPPLRVLRDLSDTNTENMPNMLNALAGLILDWNFPDENGNPLGSPSVETVLNLPADLIGAIMEQYRRRTVELNPK